jgi:hypothetical protein
MWAGKWPCMAAICGGLSRPKNPRCPILWANDASKSEIIAAEGRELLESEGVYVDARFFVQAATKIVQASIHEEWLTIRK